MNRSSIKNFFAIALALSFIVSMSNITFAADIKKVKIKTSATCDGCKTKIENKLKTMDGIKSSNLNLKDKYVTIQYDSKVTNPNDIRNVIAKLGYDADNVKALKTECSSNSEKSCADKPKGSCCTKAKSECNGKK